MYDGGPTLPATTFYCFTSETIKHQDHISQAKQYFGYHGVEINYSFNSVHLFGLFNVGQLFICFVFVFIHSSLKSVWVLNVVMRSGDVSSSSSRRREGSPVEQPPARSQPYQPPLPAPVPSSLTNLRPNLLSQINSTSQPLIQLPFKTLFDKTPSPRFYQNNSLLLFVSLALSKL